MSRGERVYCPKCGEVIPDELITRRSGQIGGNRTRRARGPGYYSRLAGMRKNFRGGRPRPRKKSLSDVVRAFDAKTFEQLLTKLGVSNDKE